MVRNKGSKIVRTPADRARAQYTEFQVRQKGELLECLMKEMAGISRNAVKSMLSNRRVFVNNVIVTQYNHAVEPGMRIRISKTKNNKEFTSPYLKLLYEDKYFIVIDKKAGIPANTLKDKGNKSSIYSILNEYVKRSARERRIFMIHTMDTDASGLMIFAKDEKTKNTFQNYWDEIIQQHTFVTVVEGKVEKDKGIVTSWFSEEEHQLYISYVLTQTKNDKKAITSYKTIRRSERFSLLELETTRNNQARLHLSSLKNPITGDERNGAKENPLGKIALHAFRLNFYHPITGELMKFETTYPSNFKGVLITNND